MSVTDAATIQIYTAVLAKLKRPVSVRAVSVGATASKSLI
jgi:hypothetical protein